MIKVNLLRSRVVEAGAPTEVSGTDSDQLKAALLKIFFIAFFTIGIMIYESQNIRALNEQRIRAHNQLVQLQDENTAKAAEVAKVKDIEGQAKELEDKLKILKLLSKLRLREVKTLDFMQSSIPEKVWLRTINFESDKIRVQEGHFVISGNSVTTEDLAEFVKRLDDSAYLQDVIVVKNQEIPVNKSSSVREFQFTAEVENKN